MMKLNSKRSLINIILKYVAIFIAAVSGYWLIYWVTMWGLFGVANVSKSESIMNWLADNNHFYPARESTLSNYFWSHCVPSPIQADSNNGSIEEGLAYLKRDVWFKDEMDSIQCLAGLFDELNVYDLDHIKVRNELVERSPELKEIEDALENCNIDSLRKPYNFEGDSRITPRFYLKNCKKYTKIHNENPYSSEYKESNQNIKYQESETTNKYKEQVTTKKETAKESPDLIEKTINHKNKDFD